MPKKSTDKEKETWENKYNEMVKQQLHDNCKGLPHTESQEDYLARTKIPRAARGWWDNGKGFNADATGSSEVDLPKGGGDGDGGDGGGGGE
jgi:hypothetical protein